MTSTLATEPERAVLGGVVLDDLAAGQAVARIFSTGYDRFTDQQAACGYCAHPIRLRGTATTIDTADRGGAVPLRLAIGAGRRHLRAVREPARGSLPVLLA